MTRKRNPKDRPEHDSDKAPCNRDKHHHGQRQKLMGKGKDKKRRKSGWFQR